jgi:hypothetical protein
MFCKAPFPVTFNSANNSKLYARHDLFMRDSNSNSVLYMLADPTRWAPGTGIWAIDFADEFPDATVIGCDLSPIQPQWVRHSNYHSITSKSTWMFPACG